MLTFAEGLKMFAKSEAVAWAEGSWLAAQDFLPTSRAGVLNTAPAVVSVAPASVTVKLLTR